MTEDLTGQTLGPFAIDQRIGQGAMGAVYVARHQENGKQVAIKVMTPRDPEAAAKLAARFEREIKLLGKFRHPNIVRFYGASEDRGIRYYAMEYVDGAPLDYVLDRVGILPLSKMIAYVVQICEALQEMHSTGVVHRDLKPANILITKDNKVKLTDFGIAKDTSAFSEQQLTAADHTVGTVAYMSPEQLAGQDLTRKSDLYALGIVMYRMLTGKLPFNADTMFDYVQQRQAGVYSAPTTINPDLPFDIDKLLSELLAQKPEDRPRDAYVVMQRLLDLAKAEKDGTLTKTQQRPVEVAETVEMKRPGVSTLLSTVFRSRRAAGAKSKRRKDADVQSRGSLLESPWVLGTALLGVLAFTGYMLFWPMSDEQMFARGKTLMEREDVSLVDMEKADEEYFSKILERSPQSSYLPEIEQYRQQIAVERARTRVNVARRQGYRPAKDASEPERQFVEAIELKEKEEDILTADARFRDIIEVFSSDPRDAIAAPWVALANEELMDQTSQSDKERREQKRRLVQEKLSKISEKRLQGQISSAQEEYLSLQRLYGADPDVTDLIEREAIHYLPADAVLAAALQLMASNEPDDWEQAFHIYLDPLLEKHPDFRNNPQVIAALDKRDTYRCRQRVMNQLKVGLTKDVPDIEAEFVVTMYIWKELGDDLTAHHRLSNFVQREPSQTDARTWTLLAKEAMAEIEKARDPFPSPDKLRSLREELARNALTELQERTKASPMEDDWRERVQRAYKDDPDTASLVDEILK